MKRNYSYSNGQQAGSDAASKALLAIYAGIFLIDHRKRAIDDTVAVMVTLSIALF